MGLSQPRFTGPILFVCVNNRSSALNASVAAGISWTAALVQLRSYSRAVLSRCWEKFVISG